MPRLALAVIVGTAACSACGPGNDQVDAAPHGDGPCGDQLFFTGDYTDWDSSETGTFCGIFNARFEVAGDATRSDMTNPNGRFELWLAQAATTRIDITPPTAASQCTTGTYGVPGIAIAAQSVICHDGHYSARAPTMGRLTPFFESFGLVYDINKGQLVVHIDGAGAPGAVTVDSAHDAAIAFDGTTWATGGMGMFVLFPNTAPGMANVQMAGAIGNGLAPIEAGKFTYVTLLKP